MTIREMVDKTAAITAATTELRTRNDAYEAGYDCALNGANEKNCHFSWFASPSLTEQWGAGKRAGEAAKRKRP